MSLYIRVMTSFWSHRKTAKLRGMIGDDALWVPLRLWSYAAEHQPDGCFKQYSSIELAMLLGYNKDAQAMLEALHQAGFMDDMSIHGWEEHNGFHQKFSDRAKKASEARWAKAAVSPQTPLPDTDTERDTEQALLKHCLTDAPSIPDPEREELNSFLAKLKEHGQMGLWDDFRASRKKKGKPMTLKAEVLLLREVFRYPSKIQIGLEKAIRSGWTGFEWEWVNKDLKSNSSSKPSRPKTPAKEIEVEDLMTPILERKRLEREAALRGELEEVFE